MDRNIHHIALLLYTVEEEIRKTQKSIDRSKIRQINRGDIHIMNFPVFDQFHSLNKANDETFHQRTIEVMQRFKFVKGSKIK
jgi:hypothetical protein